MAPYIYMERNGIHIINLYKTAAKEEEEAGKKINKVAALFVAKKASKRHRC
jgi:small subunit ribosomal protein S2